MEFYVILLLFLLIINVLIGLLGYYYYKNLKKNSFTILTTLLLITIGMIIILIWTKYSLNKSNNNNNNILEKFNTNKLNNQSGSHLSKQKRLLKQCGLPDTMDTSHCFADGTHHTCCMLGENTRNYADSSGNPIGSAARKAFKKRNGRNAKSTDKTPWCTCSGSSVCSQYAKNHKDTFIKFINNPKSGKQASIVENVSPKCEKHYTNKFGIMRHGTPGVNRDKSANKNTRCEKGNKSRKI